MPDTTRQIPDTYIRYNEYGLQMHSRYCIDSILPRFLPEDALCMIAITEKDLYPEEDWNFVFGQASLNNKVGIWSIARIQNTTADVVKERLYKIATHEILHMLSIKHCVRYECLLNGSNSMYETDLAPKLLCPDCLIKLCYNTRQTPEAYCRRMLHYYTTTQDTTYKRLLHATLAVVEQ